MSNSPSGDNVIELSNGYFYWNSEGQTLEDQKKKKELEKENTRLKRLVADLSLDNDILKEASRTNS